MITNKTFFTRGKVKILGNDVNSISFTHKLEVQDSAHVGYLYKVIIQWLNVTSQKNQSLDNPALLTLELEK
jgi:hypothetical protein